MHSNPRAYHQLMRTLPWWRPLSFLAVGGLLYLAFSIPLLFTSDLSIDGTFGSSFSATPNFEDLSNPANLFFMLAFLAVFVPVVVLGMRLGGGTRGELHSVTSKFRWGLAWRAAKMIAPVYLIVLVGSFLLDLPPDAAWPQFNSALVIAFLVILLLTPLQCAAEEYLFRGVPMQVLGRWLPSPLIGILVPIPFFMYGHEYDWVGQIDIAVFALCMGTLAWKSGGLELPIVMHTANNLIIFLLTPFAPSLFEQGEIPPVAMIISVGTTIAITIWLWRWISGEYHLHVWEPVTTSDGQHQRRMITCEALMNLIAKKEHQYPTFRRAEVVRMPPVENT